jgi:hypothetical protein
MLPIWFLLQFLATGPGRGRVTGECCCPAEWVERIMIDNSRWAAQCQWWNGWDATGRCVGCGVTPMGIDAVCWDDEVRWSTCKTLAFCCLPEFRVTCTHSTAKRTRSYSGASVAYQISLSRSIAAELNQQRGDVAWGPGQFPTAKVSAMDIQSQKSVYADRIARSGPLINNGDLPTYAYATTTPRPTGDSSQLVWGMSVFFFLCMRMTKEGTNMRHLKRVWYFDWSHYLCNQRGAARCQFGFLSSLLPRVAGRAVAFCYHCSSRTISGWLCVNKALQPCTVAKYYRFFENTP